VSGPVTSVARVEDVQIFLKDPVLRTSVLEVFMVAEQKHLPSNLYYVSMS